MLINIANIALDKQENVKYSLKSCSITTPNNAEISPFVTVANGELFFFSLRFSSIKYIVLNSIELKNTIISISSNVKCASRCIKVYPLFLNSV